MKIIITGVRGFIGYQLYLKLKEEHEIIGIDNCSGKGTDERIIDSYFHGQFDQFKGIDDADVLIHLAAKAGVRESLLYPMLYHQDNVVRSQSLFEKYVDKTASEFCNELYMSKKDIETMVSEGMYIGSHTYNHYFLNSVDKLTQENEIDKSVDFLGSVRAPIDNWIMCYPYGAYNADTLSILENRNCSVGLTTKVGDVYLYSDNLLELNRFDTNDFPQ